VKAVFEIEALLRADPTRARQALRTMLKDGIIELEPQADGTYIARGTVFPLMPLLLSRQKSRSPATARPRGYRPYAASVARGRYARWNTILAYSGLQAHESSS
jgi:hypothetical protein